MAGFLNVLLRGLALCGQTMAIGGVLFAVLVLRPAARDEPAGISRLRRTLLLIAAGAAGVIAAQALALAVQLGALTDDGGWPLRAVFATGYFRASLLKALLCLLMIAGAVALRRRAQRRGWWPVLIGLAALLAVSAAWISHAAARLEHRAPLLAFDALHQLAAAVWVGGLVHLVAGARGSERPWSAALLTRFSAMSLAAVVVLVASGVGLTVLFAAASLTSLPPAVDVVTDRATLAEVATRFTPRWPRLSSPPI